MPLDLRAVRPLASQQDGVVSAEQALAADLTRSQIDLLVRRGEWRPLLAGIYLVDTYAWPERWPDLPLATRLRAALLTHGPESAACLDTAARVHAMPGLRPDDGTIDVVLPPGRERRQQPGVRIHTRKVADVDIEQVRLDGAPWPSTSWSRTVADLICSYGEWDAVSLLDALGHAGQLMPDNLPMIAQRLVRRRGAVEARRFLKDTDHRSESPLETRIRLIATGCGLRPHELQLDICDARGRFLGRADMAWRRPGRRTLVAEADGRLWHEAPVALLHDRRRANAFSAAGNVDVVRFTWDDTRRPSYVVGVLRAHLLPRS